MFGDFRRIGEDRRCDFGDDFLSVLTGDFRIGERAFLPYRERSGDSSRLGEIFLRVGDFDSRFLGGDRPSRRTGLFDLRRIRDFGER